MVRKGKIRRKNPRLALRHSRDPEGCFTEMPFPNYRYGIRHRNDSGGSAKRSAHRSGQCTTQKGKDREGGKASDDPGWLQASMVHP